MDHISQFVKAMRQIQVEVASPPNSDTSSASVDPWLGFRVDWAKTSEARRQLEAARRAMAGWINGEVEGLVLAGHPGSGKSHLARVAKAFFGDPLHALVIAEPELKASIQASYNGVGEPETVLIGRLRRAPRLILDDIGTAYVKLETRAWWQEIFWRLLDKRAEQHMPLMLTTNLELPALAEWLGARAFSRLADLLGDESNFVDMFQVPDYRMRNWKERRPAAPAAADGA